MRIYCYTRTGDKSKKISQKVFIDKFNSIGNLKDINLYIQDLYDIKNAVYLDVTIDYNVFGKPDCVLFEYSYDDYFINIKVEKKKYKYDDTIIDSIEFTKILTEKAFISDLRKVKIKQLL